MGLVPSGYLGISYKKKSRLVCKCYAQEEGLDYGEIFSPIARMEGVRNILAYDAYKGFKV